MKKMLIVFLPLVCLWMVSCSQTETYAMPESYQGGTAIIKDSFSLSSTGLKAEIFTVDEIDGKRDTTSPYTYVSGGGMGTNVGAASRKIPTKEVLVTIAGRNVYGADGAALLDFNKSKSVSGDIFFKPQAGRTYEVKGSLSRAVSTVWLVDTSTGKRVGPIITKK